MRLAYTTHRPARGSPVLSTMSRAKNSASYPPSMLELMLGIAAARGTPAYKPIVMPCGSARAACDMRARFYALRGALQRERFSEIEDILAIRFLVNDKTGTLTLETVDKFTSPAHNDAMAAALAQLATATPAPSPPEPASALAPAPLPALVATPPASPPDTAPANSEDADLDALVAASAVSVPVPLPTPAPAPASPAKAASKPPKAKAAPKPVASAGLPDELRLQFFPDALKQGS